MNYINFTAGLLSNKTGQYIYIRSSHIESKQFDRLFYTLSDDLLYRLAQGEECAIIDCSSNKRGKVIKSIPIMVHILKRLWFNKMEYKGLEKKYMDRIYRSLSHHTKQKLRYFKRYISCNEILLKGINIKVQKEILGEVK